MCKKSAKTYKAKIREILAPHLLQRELIKEIFGEAISDCQKRAKNETYEKPPLIGQ
jgi:hypothetical protein